MPKRRCTRAGELGPNSPELLQLLQLLRKLLRDVQDGKTTLPVVELPDLEVDAVLYVRRIPGGRKTG
jgi:hypothetical protein